MRRLFVILGIALIASTATVAGAGNVLRINRVDVSHAEPVLRGFLSEYCGFAVYVQGEGYLNITVHFNRDGRIVRESYSSPGAFVTYSAPSSGRSYRFPWMPREEFVYPGGAIRGGSAEYRLTGMIVKHPGVPPEAGLIALTGTVVAFAPDGAPIVEFSDADFEAAIVRGRSNDGDATADAICAALAP